MSDNQDVLDFLRERFKRVDDKLDRIGADMLEVKERLTAVEIQVGNLSGTEASHYGATMLRLDRLEQRLDRIETRLNLVDVP